MKVRAGFVSNSSSSSFVIAKEDFKDMKELAKHMLKAVDSKDVRIKKLDKLVLSEDHWQPKGLSFQSCNYDTYILPVQDFYLITTCNNEDWNLDSRDQTLFEELLSEDLSQLKYLDHVEYTRLETGIKGYHAQYSELDSRGLETVCRNCFSDIWVTENGIRCSGCGQKPAERKRDEN